jgi:SAM-dependent methyltransferase
MSAPSLMEIFALHAAAENALSTGLLAHLAERPSSAADAAGALDLDPNAVRLVLEVLRTANVVEAGDGRYAIPSALRRELDGPGGEPAGNALVWSGAPELVRRGRTMLRGDAADRAAAYPAMVGRLGAMFRAAASVLAGAVAPALPARACILDVGAGSGVWSLALLEQRSDARATALDLPPVVSRFEAAARERGLADRVETLGGDYATIELPAERFDRIVLGNVLHLEAPERARALLERMARALRPGGHVIVVDAYPSAGSAAERRHAAYALHLGLRLPGAYPHREHDVRRWLTDIGFARLERLPLEAEPALMAALIAA